MDSLVGNAMVFFGLSGCANTPNVPSPPLKQLFSLEVAGNKLETEVRIKEKQTYTFGLSFLFRKSDKNDLKKVVTLTGDSSQNAITGVYSNLGVPLSIRLKIESIGDKPIPFHFDKLISEIPHYAIGPIYPDPEGDLDAYLSHEKKSPTSA